MRRDDLVVSIIAVARLVRIAASFALALCAGSCQSAPRTLPPRGEALVVVDTDLPAPSIAGHFRLDLYAEDGRWYESRSLAVPDPDRWPLSFSVYSEDMSHDTLVIVRLRIYPEGRERDYHGERYDAPEPTGDAGTIDAPATPTVVRVDDFAPLPRLDRGHGDETPSSEPLPRVTVDRLLLVRLVPGVRGSVRATLGATCVGTMSKLAARSLEPVVIDEARTCVNGALVPLDEANLDPDMTIPTSDSSKKGTFGTEQACDPAGNADVACVPSGVFLFGGEQRGNVDATSTMPDRLVRVSRFFIDRREVTVAKFRDALGKGLVVTRPPMGNFQPQNKAACPWTAAPDKFEGYALTCVAWETARAYCQMRGGDLPTEVQWELAATHGHRYKTRFPWGDAPATCDQAIFGRAYANEIAHVDGPWARDCFGAADEGPAPVADGLDVTDLGVFGMGGGVTEWTRDDGRPLSDPCWTSAPFTDPSCASGGTLHTLRGGGWRSSPPGLAALTRFSVAGFDAEDDGGFRCSYPSLPSTP